MGHMTYNVGDIVLIQRPEPVIATSFYKAKILKRIEGVDRADEHVLYEIKPLQGIFRRKRYVLGFFVRALLLSKEVAELETMARH
jgi:hypothetical protein